MNAAEATRLEGDVTSVVYAAEETGWTVFDLKDSDSGRSVRMTGVAPGVTAGERVRAKGAWSETRFGRQFKCSEITLLPPSTLEGLEAWLSSGAIDGIGPTYARKLVRAFGERLIEILDNRASAIESIPGIGPQRRKRITEGWSKHKGVRDVMMFLAEHGISTTKSKKIHEQFGDKAVGVLRAQPYRLTEITGFGFLTADQVAQKMGVQRDAPERLRAGVLHVLETAALYGNCGLRTGDAIEQSARLLGAQAEDLRGAVDVLEQKGKIVRACFGDGETVFVSALAEAERTIAEALDRLSHERPAWAGRTQQARQQAVTMAEAACGIALSASQRVAVNMAMDHAVLLINGGPGCGKTTTTRVVIEVLSRLGASITLGAPTGRAAKRLSEVTGRESTTIHRMLGHAVREPKEIEGDVVLLDEASMIDVQLMVRVLRAMRPGTGLILVGDADQLPSVGPGNVFGDLIESRRIPTATLTEVHRQAAGSPIVRAAHEVRDGRVPHLPQTGDCVGLTVSSREKVTETVEALIRDALPNAYGLDVREQVQVLTPMRKGPAGSICLNERLQSLLNPHAAEGVRWGGQRLAVGDKVLCTENNHDKGIYNGDLGFVIDIDQDAAELHVVFDGRTVVYTRSEAESLLLGYAITVHKSQGTEHDAIVLAVAREHFKLLNKNLVFTAITRAKRYCFVVSESGAMELAVRRNNDRRITTLRERLLGALA